MFVTLGTKICAYCKHTPTALGIPYGICVNFACSGTIFTIGKYACYFCTPWDSKIKNKILVPENTDNYSSVYKYSRSSLCFSWLIVLKIMKVSTLMSSVQWFKDARIYFYLPFLSLSKFPRDSSNAFRDIYCSTEWGVFFSLAFHNNGNLWIHNVGLCCAQF